AAIARRLVDLPIQLRTQPAEQKESGRFKSGPVIDIEIFDFGKMMMRRRVIKELRNSMAHLVESCPIKIAKHDSLFRFLLRGFDEMHLTAKILPRLAIEDQSIDPRPKLRVHRVGKIVLPPKVKWQVGIEVGKDNAREEFYARAFQRKRKLLGTNLFAPGARNMAMRVDPGFHAIFLRDRKSVV